LIRLHGNCWTQSKPPGTGCGAEYSGRLEPDWTAKHRLTPCAFSCFCAFDYDAGQLRFDTDGSIGIAIQGQGETPLLKTTDFRNVVKSRPSISRNRPSISRIVVSPEYSTEWFGIGVSASEPDHATIHIELRRPESEPTGLGSAMFRPETAGLCEYRPGGSDVQFEEILDSYIRKDTTVTSKKISESEYALIFDFKSSVRRTIIVDPLNGYTVTRMNVCELDPEGIPKDVPQRNSSASWEKVENIWVPNRCAASSISKEGILRSVEMEIKWESVNPDSVNQEYFSYSDFRDVWGQHLRN
jgi:hypothetical protein